MTRLTQLKKLFLIPEHSPKDQTFFDCLVLSWIALMVSDMVDHFDERAMDIIEKVLHDLFVRGDQDERINGRRTPGIPTCGLPECR